MISETVYLTRDNDIALKLSRDGAAIDHAGITRAQVLAGATMLDSDTAPALFGLGQADRLVLKFGQSGLAAGRYQSTLVIFDAQHSNGLVWGDFLMIVR